MTILPIKEMYLNEYKHVQLMLCVSIGKTQKFYWEKWLNEIETKLSILNNQEKEQWEDTLKKRR